MGLSYITRMIRPILFHPDPRLKKACADVVDITDAVRGLAEDMLETMYDAPGIGASGFYQVKVTTENSVENFKVTKH